MASQPRDNQVSRNTSNSPRILGRRKVVLPFKLRSGEYDLDRAYEVESESGGAPRRTPRRRQQPVMGTVGVEGTNASTPRRGEGGDGRPSQQTPTAAEGGGEGSMDNVNALEVITEDQTPQVNNSVPILIKDSYQIW